MKGKEKREMKKKQKTEKMQETINDIGNEKDT